MLAADSVPPNRLQDLRICHAVDLLRTSRAHISMQKERHRALDLATVDRTPCRFRGEILRLVFARAVMQKPCNARLLHVRTETLRQHGGGVCNAERMLVTLLLQPSGELFFHRLIIHEYRPSL